MMRIIYETEFQRINRGEGALECKTLKRNVGNLIDENDKWTQVFYGTREYSTLKKYFTWIRTYVES